MTTEFIRRKAAGTAAEIALKDLLTAHGGIVTMNQVNRDAVMDAPGAAVAHVAAGAHHLPDLTVLFPSRHPRQIGIEAKTKEPLMRGGWGWDRHAFQRAWDWSVLSGDPVFYAIRDGRIPLPADGQLDHASHWVFASVWKLMHAPTKSESGPFIYWPAEEFISLVVLLLGADEIATQVVPFIPASGGAPPLLL